MVPRKPVCRAVTGNVVISQLVANIQQVEAQTQGITSLPRPCSRSYAQSVGALLLYGSLSPTNLKLSLHRSCFFSKHFWVPNFLSIFMKQWCQKRSFLHNHSDLELVFSFRNCSSENNLFGKSRTSNLQNAHAFVQQSIRKPIAIVRDCTTISLSTFYDIVFLRSLH